MWLIFLTFHLIGNTGYNLVLRKSLVAKTDPWVLATVMQTGIALPMLAALLIAPPSRALYTPANILLVVVTAVLVVLLHAANVKALQYLEAGNFSVLYNLRILITTALGIIFLGEHTSILKMLGGLLIFLAITMVRQKGSRTANMTGFAWGVAAALVISFLNLSEKATINAVGYLGYAVPVMLTAAAIMWLAMAFRRQKIPISTFAQPKTISLMALRAMSAYGFTLALNAGGSLSVSTYVSSLGVILTVLSGTIILKERDYLKEKAIATILAVLGLTAILLPRL